MKIMFLQKKKLLGSWLPASMTLPSRVGRKRGVFANPNGHAIVIKMDLSKNFCILINWFGVNLHMPNGLKKFVFLQKIVYYRPQFLPERWNSQFLGWKSNATWYIELKKSRWPPNCKTHLKATWTCQIIKGHFKWKKFKCENSQ
jgi:hypothetical protein